MTKETYVPGEGPFGARIVFVGESPSYEEINAGRPFVGPSGQFLNSLMSKAGIARQNCWVTNVCKYFVPPSPKEKPIPFHVRAKAAGVDLNQQIMDLKTESAQIKPNIIIPVGGTA